MGTRGRPGNAASVKLSRPARNAGFQNGWKGDGEEREVQRAGPLTAAALTFGLLFGAIHHSLFDCFDVEGRLPLLFLALAVFAGAFGSATLALLDLRFSVVVFFVCFVCQCRFPVTSCELIALLMKDMHRARVWRHWRRAWILSLGEGNKR